MRCSKAKDTGIILEEIISISSYRLSSHITGKKDYRIDVFQIYFWECMPIHVFYYYTDYLS